MISHALGCIFVHNRKCAGSSIKALIQRHDPELPERNALNDGVLDEDWSLRRKELGHYLAFTVVRNPWDRFVSGCRYCGVTRHRSIEDVLENPPEPDLWRNVWTSRGSLRLRVGYGIRRARQWGKGLSTYRRGHDYRHVTRPQRATLFDGGGQIVVDRVIYFEAIEDGLSELGKDLGVGLTDLPKRKMRPTGRPDYRSEFTDRARHLFEARFAPDIADWGYDFDSGLPRALT